MHTIKINLGCGNTFHEDWINLDYSPKHESIIKCNFLEGIPFKDDYADVIYHSHVLEHFSKEDGQFFLKECYRVLKPHGILRVVVPDLEGIVNSYLSVLKDAKSYTREVNSKYEWAIIELIDQMVRKEPGGEAKKILAIPELKNEDFIYSRWGEEAKNLRINLLTKRITKNELKSTDSPSKLSLKHRFSQYLKKSLFKTEYFHLKKMKEDLEREREFVKLGKFIKNGELHNWMYDSYSLSTLLKKIGFNNIKALSAHKSGVPNWEKYNLDIATFGKMRKPDSLFMEAIK